MMMGQVSEHPSNPASMLGEAFQAPPSMKDMKVKCGEFSQNTEGLRVLQNNQLLLP